MTDIIETSPITIVPVVATEVLKTCTQCKETKPISNYGKEAKVKKDGRKSMCKPCVNSRKAAKKAAVPAVEKPKRPVIPKIKVVKDKSPKVQVIDEVISPSDHALFMKDLKQEIQLVKDDIDSCDNDMKDIERERAQLKSSLVELELRLYDEEHKDEKI
jgi:hypothetical protein